MFGRLQSGLAKYGVACALVCGAFLVHDAFLARLGDHLVFLAFLPAALLAAWFGGLAPGLAALALGFLLGDFFFLPPKYDFVPRGMPEFMSLMIYLFTGLFGVSIIAWHHRVRDDLEVSQSHKRTLEQEMRWRESVEAALRKSDKELRAAQGALREHADTLEKEVAQRTATLKETVTALENVLYHVAHDLRAPVRAMHGFTELLLENYGAQLDPTGKNYTRRIEEACRKMDELTSDLLEYGRLGYEKLEWTKVDLEAMLGRLLLTLEEEIKQRGAEIELNRPLDSVVADNGVLERILMNLLTNALKFVAPGKRPRVRIWTESTAEKTRILVKDEGIGIAAEYQSKVFGVFERLHEAATYPGTGIGLAIVTRGMDRMGGTVGLESKEGRGKLFLGGVAKRAGGVMNAMPVVLQVDDDANDRLLTQLAGKRAKLRWDLRSVADGEAGIAYLAGEGIYGDRASHPAPELVLLDLKLPRKTGFEVLEWIRQHGPERLPVVVMTSSAHQKDVAQAKKLGASDYYVKPVSLRQLETLIKEIVAKWVPTAVTETAGRV